jgi:hypothetical protein
VKRTSKYISIILLGLILINTFSLALVKIHYELNKDFIIENYCINTDKPELNCDGQCHLEKLIEIVSSDDKDSNVPEPHNLNLISIEFFFCETVYLRALKSEETESKSLYLNNYTFLKTVQIERPPIG